MNLPDDWASHYRRCDRCLQRYHASEGGCACAEAFPWNCHGCQAWLTGEQATLVEVSRKGRDVKVAFCDDCQEPCGECLRPGPVLWIKTLEEWLCSDCAKKEAK